MTEVENAPTALQGGKNPQSGRGTLLRLNQKRKVKGRDSSGHGTLEKAADVRREGGVRGVPRRPNSEGKESTESMEFPKERKKGGGHLRGEIMKMGVGGT